MTRRWTMPSRSPVQGLRTGAWCSSCFSGDGWSCAKAGRETERQTHTRLVNTNFKDSLRLENDRWLAGVGQTRARLPFASFRGQECTWKVGRDGREGGPAFAGETALRYAGRALRCYSIRLLVRRSSYPHAIGTIGTATSQPKNDRPLPRRAKSWSRRSGSSYRLGDRPPLKGLCLLQCRLSYLPRSHCR